MNEDNRFLSCAERVCEVLVDNAEYLNRLDSVMGDGEHGSNVRKCFALLKTCLPSYEGLPVKESLKKIGLCLLSAGGGTATTLFGYICIQIGSALPEADGYTADEIGDALRKAQKSVSLRSKANVGDKTMMDAFLPAVDGFENCAAAGGNIPRCFAAASEAATRGKDSTAKMIAKRGRGLYVGERGLGVYDPGSVSVSLIFATISDCLQ